jgi:hypothetical protein
MFHWSVSAAASRKLSREPSTAGHLTPYWGSMVQRLDLGAGQEAVERAGKA